MTAVIGFLREAHWLNPRRVRGYAMIMLIAGILTVGLAWVTVLLGHPPFKPAPNHGLPGGTDFLSFWSAGRLAWSGAPGAPYFDQAKLAAQELQAAYLEHGVSLAFFYPPVFVLVCMPFALLPYLPGYAAFTAAQLLAVSAAFRRLIPPGWGWLALISFPGLLINLAVGQNGLFSAACYAAAAVYLDRAPVVAGVCLGFLVFKPHLALAVPVALLAARRWHALLACGGTALGLGLAAAAVLGLQSWVAFLHGSKLAVAALELHPEDWRRLVSFYTLVREFGFSVRAAYAAQTASALFALVVLAAVAVRRPAGGLLVAMMVGATLLIPPHLLDYDLAIAAVPMLVVAAQAMRGAWLGWEKLVLVTLWLLPLPARLLTDMNIPIGPPVLLAAFVVIARRALRHRLVEG